MTVYIFSTLSCSQHYGEYIKGGGDLPTRGSQVLVKGGANIADKMLVTPRGVVTTVTDEEFSIIEKDPMFQTHLANGYVSVEKKNADIEKVVVNMTTKDKSAQPAEADFDEKSKPKINKSN